MIITNPEKLWIASQFMSTETTRYYLCGVFIEPCEQGGLTITATDGHRLVSCYDPDGVCDKPIIATITKETIKALKKADNVTIDENHMLTVNKDGETIHYQPGSCEIDGTYPAWRRVVPVESTGEQSPGFNAEYLGKFKALYGFSKQNVITIYNNGKSGTIVSNGNPEILAVLMPSTNPSATIEIPSWSGLSTKFEETVAA